MVEKPIFKQDLEAQVRETEINIAETQKWSYVKKRPGSLEDLVWVERGTVAWTEGEFPKSGKGSVEWTEHQFNNWRKEYIKANHLRTENFPYRVELRTSEEVEVETDRTAGISVLCLRPDNRNFRNADEVTLNNLTTTSEIFTAYLENIATEEEPKYEMPETRTREKREKSKEERELSPMLEAGRDALVTFLIAKSLPIIRERIFPVIKDQLEIWLSQAERGEIPKPRMPDFYRQTDREADIKKVRDNEMQEALREFKEIIHLPIERLTEKEEISQSDDERLRNFLRIDESEKEITQDFESWRDNSTDQTLTEGSEYEYKPKDWAVKVEDPSIDDKFSFGLNEERDPRKYSIGQLLCAKVSFDRYRKNRKI
ncbi:MAG TPA: hypothetical protein VF828_04845 [Patescibacteria group bacterium]